MHLELIDHYEGMYLHMEKWPVRECQMHFHPDIEFMLMLNGKVECLTSNQNFLLTAGDIFIINSNQPHALASPTSGCTVIWLAIHPRFCATFFPALSSIRFIDALLRPDDSLYEGIYTSIRQIYDFYHLRPNGYVFKLHECLNRIFYDLISAERYVELSEAETNTKKRNMARASQIIDYVERNYAAKPRLEELAVKMRLSPDYLSHFVRDTLGCTFREYLIRVRMIHARELLRSHPITQLDLLLQTGFSDYRYFSRAFRRIYGCTPREYQKAFAESTKTEEDPS